MKTDEERRRCVVLSADDLSVEKRKKKTKNYSQVSFKIGW